MRPITAIWLWLAVTAHCPAKEALLLDGTAATVGQLKITVQDAYFFRALHRFREGDSRPLRPETGEELRKTVQKMIFEEMVFAEMTSFKHDAGSRSEVEKTLRQERAKSKERQRVWQRILGRFGRTESQAVDRLFKSLQVERFLQKKVETLTPIVTQAEVQRYYEQNKARFQSKDYEALKPNIILLLKKERMQKGLEEWIRFLKEKYAAQNHLGG